MGVYIFTYSFIHLADESSVSSVMTHTSRDDDVHIILHYSKWTATSSIVSRD